MTRKIVSQTSFSTGELSPRLYMATDNVEFSKALEEATNVLITPHGSCRRRNGTAFVAQAKHPDQPVRLLNFIYSHSVAFILEFGNNYIRFFTGGKQIVNTPKTITGITKANPCVVTSVAHGYSVGAQVYIYGVLGMTQINNLSIPYQISAVTADTFTLQDVYGNNINSSAFGTYTSGGSVESIYEIVSPYGTADLDTITYATSGPSSYFAHPSYAPYVLTRYSDTQWTFTALKLSPPPTYEAGYMPSGITLTPSATSGSAVTFTASASVFLTGDINRELQQISNDGTGTVIARATITAITSATVVTANIVVAFASTSAIAAGQWQMALSPVTALKFDNIKSGAICTASSVYITGTTGPVLLISSSPNRNPGLIGTTTNHNLITGDYVIINNIVGMTTLNTRVFQINVLSSTSFELVGENTSGYTAYASGGTVTKSLTGLPVDSFRSVDVGSYILANSGVLQILSITNAQTAVCTVIKTLTSQTLSGNWSLEVPDWSSTRGYPRTVGLYHQRLLFGGTLAKPRDLWFSESGIYTGFGVGAGDADSIGITLNASQLGEMSWIHTARDLVIATSGAEVTLANPSGDITPSKLPVETVRTYIGSLAQQVTTILDEIVFLQGAKTKILTFRYNYFSDNYDPDDLTFLAEHITNPALVEIAYAQEPDSTIYGVRTDGTLVSGVYNRKLKVIGWSESDTDGFFERVNTIIQDTNHQIWTVVGRTINGKYTRFIEVLQQSDGTHDTDCFSDCSSVYSSPITISGISNSAPAVVTATSHGLSNGQKIIIKSLVDPYFGAIDSEGPLMSSLNQSTFVVSGVTTNTFQLTGENTSTFNSYGSGGKAYLLFNSISGLDYLNSKTVQIRGDGAVQPPQLVTNGTINLAYPAGEVVIGLGYESTITTLPLEFNVGLGSMQSQAARWVRPTLQVWNSGIPNVNDQALPSRNSSNLMGQKIPLYTGFLYYGESTWDMSDKITITMSDPLPLELTGITGVVDGGVK